jgi:hypothetical protein
MKRNGLDGDTQKEGNFFARAALGDQCIHHINTSGGWLQNRKRIAMSLCVGRGPAVG